MAQQIEPISHHINGHLIGQRPTDGYINATAMCKAAGKVWKHYNANQNTRDFLEALAGSVGIPTDLLIVSITTGPNERRGTWVHPQVAIHLAQRLSADFAVQVSQWVFDWVSSGKHSAPSMPYHLRRYMRNRGNVPDGHFSILVEMTQMIIAPMEAAGYTLPERMLPDISSGRIFCHWLRSQGIDPDAFQTYLHYYEDGRIVTAKAYPDELLPAFRKHLREVWIPNKAVTYFRQRDPNAVEFLEAIYPNQIKAA